MCVDRYTVNVLLETDPRGDSVEHCFQASLPTGAVWRLDQADDLAIDWRKTVRKTLGIMVGATVLSTASIGLMATPGGATTTRTLKGAFTETSDYVPDNVAPGEYLTKNTNSHAGVGAGIAHEAAGTVTDVEYFAEGSVTITSTVHHGSGGSATAMPISGTGTCSNGTGIFAGVRCTYSYTGTINTTSGTVAAQITGTYKR